MMIFLVLIALLLLVFANHIRQPEVAIAAIAMPIPAVEVFIGGENTVGRRIAVCICAVEAMSRRQTTAPPE